MKKIAMSLGAATLLTTTLSANSVSDAITNGLFEGSVALYAQTQQNKGAIKDNSFGNAHLKLKYNTDNFYNFSLGLEGKGNLKIAEKYSKDWENGAAPGSDGYKNNGLLTQAYLKYELEQGFIFKAGRYESELAWLTDYQQGAIVEIDAIPAVLFTLAYSEKTATSDIDESSHFDRPLEDYTKKGVYAIEIKDEAIEGFVFNPYYYQIPDAVKFYGLKVAYEHEFGGANLEYARSNLTSKYRNFSGDDNGYIAHAEVFGKADIFKLTGGAIVTSDKGGADIMTTYGDTISPFKDGNQNYSKDARTIYASLNANIEERFDFTALYGYTRYDEQVSGMDERELNLIFEYNFSEELALGLAYVKVKADSQNSEYNGYDKYLASIEYKF
ncbi:Opr family porin [Aliarcobacter skirrowii]|uniref:Opr family porin n=1 Tax=Aliarcobacter skirrowii TaxID=28200 RepID=UPI0029A80374|nr:Opr family porin [Aliarcobacter skirrowii]MDX4011539.1 Opr family porin [Aliarcobacter skirrowii]MDX4070836.1 Opr family porin [Aliarcobacter skirrowii]